MRFDEIFEEYYNYTEDYRELSPYTLEPDRMIITRQVYRDVTSKKLKFLVFVGVFREEFSDLLEKLLIEPSECSYLYFASGTFTLRLSGGKSSLELGDVTDIPPEIEECLF